MAGIDVPFNKVQELSGEQIYAHIKRNFLKAKGADAIYMLGSGWRTLDIIETLEQDLQVPVVHPVTARVWEFQKRLHVREPRSGYGYMLEGAAVSCTRIAGGEAKRDAGPPLATADADDALRSSALRAQSRSNGR